MSTMYEKRGKIAYITLNRPEALNALTLDVEAELESIFKDFLADDETLVAIITGVGDKAFCAGADVKATLEARRNARGKPWARAYNLVMDRMELYKPLIAAVNGLCLGGGFKLAMCCDIRVASENASFGLPEVKLGWVGTTQRLPRLIPRAIAAEMILTGRSIGAAEAYRVGLVNKVVPLAELMSSAEEYARAICGAAPLAVRAAKEAMTRGLDMTLAEGLVLECKLEDFIAGTEDFEEGMRAFMEGRKPVYKGR